MVVKKMRMNQRNSSNGYDVLHPETSAEQVLIQDSGQYYQSTEVEDVLQELGQAINGTKGSIIDSVNALIQS